ncbi:MAG: response regulator transcription factor [Caldilineaceae bacterium]|nr:response regulator transcription factor [Caldilineaceae bacterium]
MSPIRVVIADDHPVLLVGMQTLLRSASCIEIVGTARSGEAALALVAELKPDVLLLDVEMPNLSGIEVARRLHGAESAVEILVLSAHADPEYVKKMMAYGVAGYLLKDEAAHDLVRAIEAVAQNHLPWFSPSIRAQFGKLAEPHSAATLTVREIEVIRHLTKGKTNYAIAQSLEISEKTVEKHLDSIYRKLNVRSRTEAAVAAVQADLL